MKTLRKENKTVVGYIIIGICLCTFCFLSISALILKGESYDTETFCPSEISGHTIVVLDKTDSFNPSQQKLIINRINKEKDGLKGVEKFSLFTLTENTYLNPNPIFSKCNPGTGENANQLYQNPRKIQMRFDEFFSKPLKEKMQNALSDNSGSRSPILEMIRELSLREDFRDDVENKTLVIISDMMHHMLEYSHYRNKIEYNYFSKRPYANEVTASLHSVKVKIIYLHRKNLTRFQRKHHLTFWTEYFEDMGASVVEVREVW